MKINTICLIEGLCNKAKLTPIGKNTFLNKKVGMLFKGTEDGYPTKCVFQEVLGDNSELDFYTVSFTYESLNLTATLDSNLKIINLDTGWSSAFCPERLVELGWSEQKIKEEEMCALIRKKELEEKMKQWIPTTDDF